MNLKCCLILMALLIAVITSRNIAHAAENNSTASLQKMANDVAQMGSNLLRALNAHKKLCWDGTDPDETTWFEYRKMNMGLIAVEASFKMVAIGHQVALSLDRFIENRLSIADAALRSNCLNMADEQYRTVLKSYPGLAYSHYRDLAKIGVDDVREKRAAQILLDQQQSVPSRIPWQFVGEWLPYSDGFPSSDIGKCKPTSPNETGPFVLKPDGSWDHLFPNTAASHCILTATPLSANSKNDWLVSSTCQPQITEFWMQTGSARDNITTHEYYDHTAEGGKKTIGNIKVRFRRCD